MQFEAPAPLLLPFRAQVNNQVQPAVPAFRVIVEVDMRIETCSMDILVRAAPVVLGVVHQVRNAA